MICPFCDGTGFCEEPGEYRMKCACEDGVAICPCGDYATRINDEGQVQCDACHFPEIEREAAA